MRHAKKSSIAKQQITTIISTYILLTVKILSSSPYSTFNSKEWNSLVSKCEKFINSPIKVQKKSRRAFAFRNIEQTQVLQEKSKLDKQMELIFA